MLFSVFLYLLNQTKDTHRKMLNLDQIYSTLSLLPNIHMVQEWDSKKTVYTNRNIFEELGHNSEDKNPEAHNWETLLHPDDKESIYGKKSQRESILKKDGHFSTEIRLKHKNGNWLWFQISETMPKNQSSNDVKATIISLAPIERLTELESNLIETNDRFQALAEASMGGIGIHDKGKIIEANHELCNLTGYSYNELIGMDDLLLIHPDQREMVTQKILSGYGESYDSVGLRKDGTSYPLEIRGKQTLYKGERVRVTEFRDISKQKNVEEALAESEAKYRDLIEFAVDGFIIGNKDGIVIEVNERLLEITGKKRQDVLRKHIKDFFTKKVIQDKPLRFDLLETGRTVVNEREIIRPDGGKVIIEMHSKKMPDGTYQAIVRDITERKKNVRRMASNEAKFKAIFDFANDAIFLMDSDSFKECNNKTEEIFGCKRSDVIGATPAQFSPEYQPDGQLSSKKSLKYIKQAISGKPVTFDWVHKRMDETLFHAEVSLNRIEIDKEIIVQAMVRDVTSRKQFEETIQESENLYRSIIENIEDVYYRFDVNEKLLMGSPSGAKMFGYKSIDDMIGISLSNLWVDPKQKETLYKTLKSKRGLKNFEVTLKKKDGQHFFTSISASYFKDKSGKIGGVEGIIRDITESKKHEQELEINEKRAQAQRAAIAELALYDFAIDPNNSSSLEKVLELSAKPIEVARTSIWLLSEEKDELKCILLYDANKGGFSQGQTLKTKEFPTYFDAISSENRISISDALTDPRTSELKDIYLKPLGISSMLDAGVLVGGSLVGVVSFEHVGEKRDWGIDEESFASNVASLVAQSIVLTEQQKAETALRESEERLRMVIDATNDAIWDWDLTTNKAYFSDRYFTMLGYEPDEFEANYENWKKLIHPNDIGFSEIIIKKYLTEQHPDYILEFRMATKNGGWKWIYARGKIVERDSDGNPTRIVGTHTDITDRKLVEEELKESHNLLQSVLDTIPVRVFWKDKNLNYLGCNKPFAKDAGFDNPKKMIGLSDFDMGWEEQANLYRTDDLAVMKSGFPKLNYEEPQTTPDGNRIWLRTSKIPLRDTTGKVIGMLGTYDDITETKKAHEIIELERAYFEQLFQGAPEGIVLLDVADNIIRCNEEFIRMFGYSQEEVTGNPINSFIVPNDLEDEGTKLTNTVAAGELVKHETVRKRKDGSLVHVSILGKPIIFKGGKLAVYGIYRDITDRKKVEEELLHKSHEIEAQNEEYRIINEELYEAKQKAEESDKLKSAFLANMSHEIRTPMNGILGFTQLLTSPDIPENDLKQYIDVIHGCGNQLLGIINDLIDISKIEANQITINKNDTNVNKTLEELLVLFKPKAIEKTIELSYIAGLPDNECTIITDTGRLKQVLSNLMGNALKFINEGYIRFGYEKKDNNLEFYVEDTGIGISPEHQEVIFERFRQIETTLTNQAGGTGLGLAISRAYILKMGGKIWVESTPGEGSKFFFTIPYKPAQTVIEHKDKEADTFLNQIGSPISILVAEDDDINFFFIKEMLANYPIDILRAKDGQEAVDMIKEDPTFDMILMDIRMPRMDGYEATRMVKSIRGNIPIIAQTAYAFSGDKERALEAGCDDYISKPIDRLELVTLMAKHLGHKKA